MPQFTADNAAEMGKRGAEARWNKPATETPIAEHSLDYTAIRLMRVRKQLDRLDELASEETDPKRCKEFADATSRLQEQERQLAGRPLPGTLKPSSRNGPARPSISPAVPSTPTPEPKSSVSGSGTGQNPQ